MPSVMDRNSVLKEMLIDRVVVTADGEKQATQPTILARYAEALYRTVVAEKPKLVVEIGMAQGASTLAILSGLEELGGDGRLVSIDPNQTGPYGSQGLASVERAGLSARHELIEDYDYSALPKLLEKGTEIDFAYIDGWHTFDYTLLDFWYVDRMLKVGGVCGFNDCGWRGVQKAIGFVMTHRRYTEMKVGLRRSVVVGRELIRFFTGRWGRQYKRMNQDRYFRKDEAWEPTFSYFHNF